MSVVDTIVKNGTYAMLTTFGWLRYAFSPMQPTVFFEGHIYFDSLPASGERYLLARMGDAWTLWYRNNDGTKQWVINIGGTEYTYNQNVAEDSWLHFSWGLTISTTTGATSLHVSGHEVISETGLNTGSTNIWQAYVIREGGTVSNVYFDDIVFSDSYIGPETSDPRFYGDGLSWVVLR